MKVLGINTFFEHPSVALVCDGELAFALEDERLTRIKHGKRYTPYRTYVPFDSICAALRFQGLRAVDLDEVACSYNRWRHLASLWGCFFRRRLSSFQEERTAFRSVSNTRRALIGGHEIPHAFRNVLAAGDFAQVAYREWDHHLAHAASAFFCSGFKEALVVVVDGSGENACTSIYVGRGHKLKRILQIPLPHSLGFFYTFITRHLGFEPFSDEYKVMGLAAYGEPRFAKAMAEIIKLESHGRYRLDLGRLQHLADILGPARGTDEPLNQAYKDIAKSAQSILENALEHVISHHLAATGLRRLCLAGGTFLNCVANQRLARLSPVSDLFVQPASHDAGTAIGAAALSSIARGGNPQLRYGSMFLGTSWSTAQTEGVLRQAGAHYVRLAEAESISRLADLLAKDRVVALFRGRMEFGPRALGNRSILASPCSARTREKLNDIKGREQFRPLAPIVTADAFGDFFEGVPSRYMMLTATVREQARKRVPAVVHADGTARVQVIRPEEDLFLYRLLQTFEERVGVPVLINTSLNVRGKPIDESPHDALVSFYSAGLDAMLLNGFLVERESSWKD